MSRRLFLHLALLLAFWATVEVVMPDVSLAGAAWAKDGDRGGDDDGGSDDDDDDDDDDNSGSGGGRDDDDDDDDDNSGSGGGGGDDDDDSGSDDDDGGSGGGSGGGSDDDDDDSGRGGGSGGGSGSDDDDDDRDDSSGGNSGSGRPGAGEEGGDSTKSRSARARASSDSTSLPALPRGLRRIYSDGREERITGNVIEKLDARGRVIERRKVTTADKSRFRQISERGLDVLIEIAPGGVSVTDRAGWREEFKGSTYRLTDPRGNPVTRRGVTRKDIARLKDLLDLP
jgi:hypothetical protein